MAQTRGTGPTARESLVRNPLQPGTLDLTQGRMLRQPAGSCIRKLVMTDFKSYRGKVQVGPFANWTCIVGPNGSGKSNLMDAISFALGLSARHLRGASLKQLIYGWQSEPVDVDEDGDGEDVSMDVDDDVPDARAARRLSDIDETDRPKKASVSLTYCEADGREVAFTRSVNRAGACTYRIGRRRVSRVDYVQKLAEYGVLVDARNFLVFQGDVESIAAKSSKDLGELFEQVSQSSQFAREYDRCKDAYEKASDEVMQAQERYKIDMTAHSKYKAQGRDARRYDRLQQQLEQKLVDHNLWRCYHLERDIKTQIEQQRAKDERVQQEEAKLAEAEGQIGSERASVASCKKALFKAEKDVNASKLALFGEQEKRDGHLAEIEHTKKQLRKARRTVKRNKKKRAECERQCETHKRQVDELKAEKESFESEIEERIGSSGLDSLDAGDLREYRQLRKKADARTMKLKQELEILHKKATSLENRVKQHSDLKSQYETTKNQHVQARENLDSVITELNEKVRGDEKEVMSLKRQAETSSAEKEVKAREKRMLQDQISKIRDRLRDVEVEREATEREARMAQAIESMKSLFTTVYGRITELYNVPQKKFEVAVNVALGIHHDAIVTDTTETAMSCVEYLKEQRIRPMMFLPLDKLRPKRGQDRVRGIVGDQCRLVIDVVQANHARFGKAVQYVFGTAVIAPELETARRLAFRGGSDRVRFKVVTLDGTIIHKSGLMTGGNAAALRDRARRSRSAASAADAAEIAKGRDEALSKVHSISRTIAELEKTIANVEERCQAIEGTLEYQRRDVRMHKKQLKTKQREIATVNKQISQKTRLIEKLKGELETQNEALEEKRSEIDAISSEVFSDFASRVDVPNIEKFEELRERLEEEKMKKLEDFEDRISKFSEAMKYEKQRLAKLNRQDRKSDVQSLGSYVTTLQEKVTGADAAIKKLETSSKQLDGKLQNLKKKLEVCEGKLQSAEELAQTISRTKSKISKELLLFANTVEQLRGQRNDICRKCSLNQILLPFGDRDRQSKRRKKAPAAAAEGSDDEDMEDSEVYLKFSEPFVIEGPEQPADSEEPRSPSRKRKRSESQPSQPSQKRLNFEYLDQDLLNVSGTEYEKIDKNFEDDLRGIREMMQSLASSVGHRGKQEAAKQRREESEQTVAAARGRLTEAQKAFEEVKAERLKAFMSVFDQVKENIDKVYKRLTISKTYPLGGTAHIALEDPDEPYLYGVNYSTMPPTKRYRKMENLSGGEKTLAALALLFAINKCRASPFFVLDEIDASLDSVNVSKVANFIKESSAECQFIVISLKNSFYQNSDALIGVYADPDTRSSHVLTFDLNRYQSEDDDVRETPSRF